LSLLLDLPRLPGRPALWIVYHTCKLLKSQSGTRKGCGAPGWTAVPPPVHKLDPKILGRMPELNVVPSRVPSTKSTAKVPPFSMRGVPAIAANPREGSRLLRFWVNVPNISSEIGTTLSRARACGRMRTG
jgi:hypothetical protein